MSEKKYMKGPALHSIDELVQQDFVYFGDKITPHGWFMSWQLAMTTNAIRGGVICMAIKIEKPKK